MRIWTGTKNLMKKATLAAIILIPTAQAFAWQAYEVRPGKWAIECNDGSMWSYSGSAAGLDIVGPALCAGHGGLANGGGPGKPVTRPATAEVRRVVEGGCTPVFYPKLPGKIQKCGRSSGRKSSAVR